SLHLLCSDRVLKSVENPSSIFDMPLVDSGKDFPTFKYLFDGQEGAQLQNRSPDRVCMDRSLTEHLIRGGAVGTMALAEHESLPAKVLALDHIVPPKRIDLVLSVRKKASRDLVESL